MDYSHRRSYRVRRRGYGAVRRRYAMARRAAYLRRRRANWPVNRQRPPMRWRYAARRGPAPYARSFRSIMARGRQIIRQPPFFNPAERLYIESVCNPFGANAMGSYDVPTGAKILDSAATHTVAYTFTHNTVLAVGTQEMIVKLTDIRDVARTCGYEIGTAVSGAGTPTAVQTNNCGQWTRERGQLSHARIVGMALKVNALSSPEDTAGYMRAGLTDVPLRTAAAVWNTYALSEAEMDDNFYNLSEGVTVRHVPQDASEYNWTELSNGVVAQEDLTGGRFLPCVRFTGGKANTVVHIACVYHVECRSTRNDTPTAAPSPVSMKWQMLQGIVADTSLQPIVTRGNSFKSFFTSVGRAIGKVAGWVANNLTPIGAIAKNVSHLLAPLQKK